MLTPVFGHSHEIDERFHWTNACAWKRRTYVVQIGSGVSHASALLQANASRVFVCRDRQTHKFASAAKRERFKSCTSNIIANGVRLYLYGFFRVCVRWQNKWNPAAWTVTVATLYWTVCSFSDSLLSISIVYRLAHSTTLRRTPAHQLVHVLYARTHTQTLLLLLSSVPGRSIRLFVCLLACLPVCLLVRRFISFLLHWLCLSFACIHARNII